MKEKEIWKIIDKNFKEGFENYSISNYGRVKNNSTNKILKPHIRNGYLAVSPYSRKLNKNYPVTVHILVGIFFVKGRKEGLILNHKDGNKENPFYKNLEWVTYGENNSHAYRTGLRSEEGTKNPSNIYNEEIIKEICSLLEKGFSTEKISLEVFSVYKPKYKNLINHIKSKRRWTCISCNYNF